jgi:redox-sensitive bicupin YhaK (pirin superfamily)
VVTYCAAGEFLHADEHGQGNILRKGWVQHTTVGKGMYHSEINNRPNEPMRFIQMWFFPWERDLTPAVQQKAVKPAERTNRLLPLVANHQAGALPIYSEARVFSCLLQPGHQVTHSLAIGQGAYLYVLEGGPVSVNGLSLAALAAAMVTDEAHLEVAAEGDAELVLVEVGLT